MHPLLPAERPASATRGAYAAMVTAVAQLVVTAGTVSFTTWTDGDDAPSVGAGVFFVSWGVVSAVLLLLAALLTLRRRHAGRVLFYVVGVIGLINHLACGVYNGIAGAEIQRLEEAAREHPPMWMAAIGMTGAVLGVAAAITGLVYYGRRSTREWLKPPPVMYYPAPQYR
ncbi:hypothetical protein [Phytomonospora endophytica]|uniref:Uncharacterized protein n=1 Tax=Phytomonospora endophytica TaxID=714109 RepID=A0A841FSP1_9ACTN|nr:hypothetical protein [Phytomonospora endophytica]MBB6039056.1 hypothetical protein [Phytomonospora endophytica]GIG71485.1 hypothetical protein Pen01_77800 [Phytomonospora endophytica]